MTEHKLTRREREKLRHRREILNAALDLFAEKGFHNVSMAEIAEKAEFGVGTLYSFFQDKEGLYTALVMDQANRFHTALCQVIDDDDGVLEKIAAYVRVKGEVFMKGAKVVRLYFAETRGASFNIKAGLCTDMREMHERFLQKLTGVFAAGMREGILRKQNPYYCALALDSLTNAFLLSWLEAPEAHPYEGNIPTIMDIFLKGVLVQ